MAYTLTNGRQTICFRSNDGWQSRMHDRKPQTINNRKSQKLVLASNDKSFYRYQKGRIQEEKRPKKSQVTT